MPCRPILYSKHQREALGREASDLVIVECTMCIYGILIFRVPIGLCEHRCMCLIITTVACDNDKGEVS